MNATIRQTAFRLAWLLLAVPLVATAQTVPAPAGSVGMDPMEMAMPGMQHHGREGQDKAHDHQAMHGHHAMQSTDTAPSPDASSSSRRKPGSSDSGQHAMHEGMDHGQTHGMEGMSHQHAATAASDMQHATHAMPVDASHDAHDMRMQGGAAPPDARSADYSDGIGYGDMAGMDMRDAAPLGMLRFDRLEAFHGEHGNGQAWELQGWYGADLDKLRLRSEGEREGGGSGAGDIEALWSHAVAPYWDTQLGVRHDFGGGPSRQWLAFGVQGLAPYWFELSATAYAGPAGRTAARLRAEYELLFTQRLILQPELEANVYSKADPQRRIGRGLSDVMFGLRLRYEIRRQFAPYLGVVWARRFGGTAGFAREEHHPVFDRQVVAGLRIWF